MARGRKEGGKQGEGEEEEERGTEGEGGLASIGQ
jgi:hypothetical protein